MKKIIKLRDMTKEQWENYECGKDTKCEKCIFNLINCCQDDFRLDWTKHKDLYSNNFLDCEVEIEENILNEKEKEYLSAVIKPFRDRVISIEKTCCSFKVDNKVPYYIYITINDSIIKISNEDIRLPCFFKDMYKGMKKNKPYTLEELDL